MPGPLADSFCKGLLDYLPHLSSFLFYRSMRTCQKYRLLLNYFLSSIIPAFMEEFLVRPVVFALG